MTTTFIRVLFVCSNNFSRSPLAAAVFNALVESAGVRQYFIADSAGAFAGQEPRPVERRTTEFARRHGIDLSSHRTREVIAGDFGQFDHLMVLDQDAYWFLKDMEGRVEESKIRRFVEAFGDLSLEEIADPVLGQASFEKTFELIEKGVRHLLRELIRGHVRDPLEVISKLDPPPSPGKT